MQKWGKHGGISADIKLRSKVVTNNNTAARAADCTMNEAGAKKGKAGLLLFDGQKIWTQNL